MSDTLSATPELLVLRRPDEIDDAQWARRQTMAHKVVTGHYPWCSDHQKFDDDPAHPGWCEHTEKLNAGDVVLSSSSLTGAPFVMVRTDVEELSLNDASVLGWMLSGLADLGRRYNVSGDPR